MASRLDLLKIFDGAHFDARHNSLNLFYAVLFSMGFALFYSPAVYALPMLVFRVWQVATCVVCVIATIIYLAECKIDARWVSFSCFFFVYYLYSSLVNDSNGWMVSILYNTVRGFGFASLVCLGLSKTPRECILGYIVGGLIMCGVNYVTFVIFKDSPSGMRINTTLQNWYFLGHDNETVFYYLPLSAACFFYGAKYSRRFKAVGFIVLVLTIVMFVYLKSAAAMTVSVCFALFVCFALARDGNRKGKWAFLSMRQAVFIGLFLAAAIVALAGSDLVMSAVGSYGKSVTFGFRQTIWGNSIEALSNSPLFGVGFNDETTRVAMLSFDHSHNVVLQVLFQSGFFGFILFLFMCISNTSGSLLHLSIDSSEIHILSACMLLCLVAGCVDYYPDLFPQFFPMVLSSFMVCSNSKNMGCHSTMLLPLASSSDVQSRKLSLLSDSVLRLD